MIFNNTPPTANVCEVLYHPGSQLYSTFRYSNSSGNRTNIKWTFALTPLVFSSENYVPEGNLACISIIVIFAFVFGHLFVLTPLSETSKGVGTVGRWGHIARGLGAIRAMCRAWQAFSTFLALGIFKANPRFSAFLIPVCVRKIWRGSFFARSFPFFCEDRRLQTADNVRRAQRYMQP